VREGGVLEIENGTFIGISSFEQGAVLNAGYQRTTTTIRGSTFMNNTSVRGGVMFIETESVVIIEDWTFSSNFGVISGVFQVSNNGYYIISNSIFNSNYAISSSISQIFDVVSLPKISNSTFSSNTVFTSSQLTSELTQCFYFCFFSESFKAYLKERPSLFDISSSVREIQLIMANLEISNGTKFIDSSSVIDSYISTVTITDSYFFNLEVKSNILKLTSSTVIIRDIEVYNITSEGQSFVMGVSFESDLTIDGFIFHNSTLGMIDLLSSTASINRLKVSGIKITEEILHMDGNYAVNITNSEFDNVSTLQN
jgi:hypothetical protein